MKKISKNKTPKTRNLLAVDAHFRNSAGPIDSKKNKKLDRDVLEEILEELDLMNEKE